MAVKGETQTQRIVAPNNTRENLDVVTAGRLRFKFKAEQPGLEGAPASSSPDAPIEAGSGVFFFRTSGGLAQACVRFPNGVVQILATEAP